MGVIVVGYVPKPEGRAALRLAAEEAKLRDASLVVVSSHGGRDVEPADEVSGEYALDTVRSRLAATDIPHEVRQPVRGIDPVDDLINVAVEVAAEVIIIGLRRRSPMGKLILGSSAQRILLGAPCPVLAVKAAE
jgi:nucleotide-binding universal stress UspA family protein